MREMTKSSLHLISINSRIHSTRGVVAFLKYYVDTELSTVVIGCTQASTISVSKQVYVLGDPYYVERVFFRIQE